MKTNFVFLITDQHRADWLGCYGHKVVRTPNIDRIAQNGIRFENFNVASPVCMPNRASIMTGRYPSVHGLRYNGCVLSQRANTFVDVLRAGGYRTASIGKSHLQPFTGIRSPLQDHLDNHHDGPIREAWKAEADNFDQESPQTYQGDNRYAFRTPYYGFDYIDMVTDHGDVTGGHYLQWFKALHPDDWQQLSRVDEQFPHNYSCPQAKRTKVPEAHYPTRYIQNQTCEWLRQHADEESPFFLFVSFPDPHHPFNPPGKYWDMYNPDQFELEAPIADFKHAPPPAAFAHQRLRDGGKTATPQEGIAAIDQHCLEAMALSAGMIAMIDDAVGDILDTLQGTAAADNTVVSFTSDHGDYLGDANLLLKGPWMRRSIYQVPFIWSDPQRLDKGNSSPVLASSLDLSSTILARTGLAPYHGMQGRNLIADIESGEGRRQLLLEHNDNGPRMGFKHAARSRTLISQGWRLSLYGREGWGELYHTDTDPLHLNNLWDDADSQSIKLAMLEQLAVELTLAMDESPAAEQRA